MYRIRGLSEVQYERGRSDVRKRHDKDISDKKKMHERHRKEKDRGMEKV
jgi:hypothetical protein